MEFPGSSAMVKSIVSTERLPLPFFSVPFTAKANDTNCPSAFADVQLLIQRSCTISAEVTISSVATPAIATPAIATPAVATSAKAKPRTPRRLKLNLPTATKKSVTKSKAKQLKYIPALTSTQVEAEYVHYLREQRRKQKKATSLKRYRSLHSSRRRKYLAQAEEDDMDALCDAMCATSLAVPSNTNDTPRSVAALELAHKEYTLWREAYSDYSCSPVDITFLTERGVAELSEEELKYQVHVVHEAIRYQMKAMAEMKPIA